MDVHVSCNGVLLHQLDIDADNKVSDYQSEFSNEVFGDIPFRVTSLNRPQDYDAFRSAVDVALASDDTMLGQLDVHIMLEAPSEEDEGEQWEHFDAHELQNLSFSYSSDPEFFKVWLMRSDGQDIEKADDVYKWSEDDEEERIWEGIDKDTRRHIETYYELKEDALEPDSYELLGEYNGDKYTYRA